MPGQWHWVRLDTAEAAHVEQIAEHGGSEGTRDITLVESAMARPQQLAAYGGGPDGPDVAALAASYAYGIARNHPFTDGNKRTALVVAETFLALNGFGLGCSDAEAVVTFVALAAGDLTEDELTDWFRTHLTA